MTRRPLTANTGPAWLLGQLTALREAMLAQVDADIHTLDVNLHCRDSAINFLHYLALRCHDLRPLQQELAALGLSSLGRAESHVLATLDAVLRALHAMAGQPVPDTLTKPPFLGVSGGQSLLARHTERLFGHAPEARHVRIMVTMPGEAAGDPALIENLLASGMNAMRINCAHDDETAWAAMIAHLRRAEALLGTSCKVVMDLAGPKLRTGPIEPGPAVLKLKPKRDVLGNVLAPARAWLVAEGSSVFPGDDEPVLEVNADRFLQLVSAGHVCFEDARGAQREWVIVERQADACCVELEKTAYLVPGLRLWALASDCAGSDDEKEADVMDCGEIVAVPPVEGKIRLQEGDSLLLTRSCRPGRPARRNPVGHVIEPARISCSIPSVFDDLKVGESVLFDDGKIGGVITAVVDDGVMVQVNRAGPRGAVLREDKGINLPDSVLNLPALTEDDLAVLPFVAAHADMVELSFANTADDIAMLQQQLQSLAGDRQPAIVIKVETRAGFRNLPDMLLTAMKAPSCGVMIARGDLAVECGFERLAEVQEEILWMCEAAHVPVIWATQVLESLAKTGLPSRAEITDAAMGHRAECVMLNKGPHILMALATLDDILRRMQSHQAKKRTMLRPLRVAGARLAPGS